MMLRNIGTFVEVSKCKSISDAAKRLFISQQTLSASIKNLEKELGFPLFIRSASGIKLTEKGSEFLVDAIKIQNILDYWTKHDETEEASDLSGTVDIAGGEPFGTLYVKMVSILKESHPNIVVKYHMVSSPELPNYLRAKKARIGIASCSYLYSAKELQQFAEDRKLAMEQIGTTRLVMIVNKDNPLRNEPAVSLSDCKHLCLAVRQDEKSINFIEIEKYFHKVFSFYGLKQIFNFISANKDAAAFVPMITYKEDIVPMYDNLERILLTDYGVQHPLFLFYPHADECSPEEIAVINLIRKLEENRNYF